MKKLALIIVAGGILLLVLLGMVAASAYNGLVRAAQAVDRQWAQVENVYQRRADLIPNLVNTVSGAADFERSTITEVTEARASVGRVTLPQGQAPTDVETLQRYQQAQDALSGALSRLLVVVERYPELKANANFRDLQAQLEGTENRIAVERGRFNEAVQAYNTLVKTFPRNLFAGIFGFRPRPYFTAQPGAERAPEVRFDFGREPETP